MHIMGGFTQPSLQHDVTPPSYDYALDISPGLDQDALKCVPAHALLDGNASSSTWSYDVADQSSEHDSPGNQSLLFSPDSLLDDGLDLGIVDGVDTDQSSVLEPDAKSTLAIGTNQPLLQQEKAAAPVRKRPKRIRKRSPAGDERRRLQNREAQRNYRKRKDDAIKTHEKENVCLRQLENQLSQENASFSQENTNLRLAVAGLTQENMHLRQTIASLVQKLGSGGVVALPMLSGLVLSGLSQQQQSYPTGGTMSGGVPDYVHVDVDVSGILSEIAGLGNLTGYADVNMNGGVSDTVPVLPGSIPIIPGYYLYSHLGEYDTLLDESGGPLGL